MRSRNTDHTSKLRKLLGEKQLVDAVGSGAVAIGIVLVALDMILRSQIEGFATVFRVIGGISFLFGIGMLIFGTPRRRDVLLDQSKRLAGKYMEKSSGWDWPFRFGVASTAIGLMLILPMTIFQFLFGNNFGVAVLAIVFFWSGVALIVYGWYRRRKAAGIRAASTPERTRSRRRR